jgi:exopolysaccharide production protein ExoZ
MYKSIQGCRAVAALLVVLHHLGTALSSERYFGATRFAAPFRFGDSGVEFFFVLSGFIITWAHFADFGKPGRVFNYLRKRVVRIYPTYLIVFATVYLLAFASPITRSAVPHDYATILKSLALVPQDPGVAGGNGAPVLVVAWTLQYEVCFYALVAAFIANRYFGAVIMAGLLMNLIQCHFRVCAFPSSFFSSNLFLLFGIGVAVALAGMTRIRLQRPTWIALASAFGFLGFALLEGVLGQNSIPVDRRLVYGMFSAALIFALIRAEGSGQLQIANQWIPLLGDSSYALYLIHYPLISILCKCLLLLGLTGVVGAAVAFPAILCCCVVVAVAFHLLVEKPLLRTLSIKSFQPKISLVLP